MIPESFALVSILDMNNKKRLRELYEEAKRDPNLTISEEFMAAKQVMEKVNQFEEKILHITTEFANSISQEDENWPVAILIAYAKTTCTVIHAMELTSKSGRDLFSVYADELLPLCKQIEFEDPCNEITKDTEQLTVNIVNAILNTKKTDEEIVDEYFHNLSDSIVFSKSDAITLVSDLRKSISLTTNAN